jgi:hypothetical protein
VEGTIPRIKQTGLTVLRLAVALVFVALMTSGLALFPNPYMPPKVAQAHFYEILSSMLVFGGLAGWVMNRSPSVRQNTTRRGSPLLALLVLLPSVAGMFLL